MLLQLFHKRSKNGFTLVELLIVVAIIGVLSTIGVPTFRRMIQKSRKSEAKVNLGGLYTAEAAFFAEYGAYGDYLNKLGFEIEGAPDGLIYTVGFFDAACAGNGTANNPRPDPASADLTEKQIGTALKAAYPSYWNGGVVPLTEYRVGFARAAVPPVACDVKGVVDSAAAVSLPRIENTKQYVAAATGVIAPGIDRLNPAVGAGDVWSINHNRVLANVNDGVQ